MPNEQYQVPESAAEAERQQQIIGMLLRRLRQIAGLSQGRLADRSDTDPSYLSGLEHGHGRISMYKLGQVCRAMNAEEAMLLHLCRQLTHSMALGQVITMSNQHQSKRRS